MNDIEKIYDLIKRNYSHDVQMQDHETQVVLFFKRTQFTSWDLNGLFTYFNPPLKKENMLKEWRIEAVSNQNVEVLIWLRKGDFELDI